MDPTVASDRQVGINLFEAFQEATNRHADKTALKADGGRGSAYTYSDLLTNVRRLASGLSAPEFSDQNEIGLIAENRPEWATSSVTFKALSGFSFIVG